MTSTIDWAHEIDTSLHGVDQPPAAYVEASLATRPRRRPTSEDFHDYVVDRESQVRRLAHAICCDWTQAEALVVSSLTALYDSWHRFGSAAEADAFLHCALARAEVTDSPTPRSCNAHGVDYPIEDESLLFDGLQSLTAIQRKALVLHDWLDLPVDEVARAIGISSDQVLIHTARGRSALSFLLPETG